VSSNCLKRHHLLKQFTQSPTNLFIDQFWDNDIFIDCLNRNDCFKNSEIMCLSFFHPRERLNLNCCWFIRIWETCVRFCSLLYLMKTYLFSLRNHFLYNIMSLLYLWFRWLDLKKAFLWPSTALNFESIWVWKMFSYRLEFRGLYLLFTDRNRISLTFYFDWFLFFCKWYCLSSLWISRFLRSHLLSMGSVHLLLLGI
jgi:hypothetical protein